MVGAALQLHMFSVKRDGETHMHVEKYMQPMAIMYFIHSSGMCNIKQLLWYIAVAVAVCVGESLLGSGQGNFSEVII